YGPRQLTGDDARPGNPVRQPPPLRVEEHRDRQQAARDRVEAHRDEAQERLSAAHEASAFRNETNPRRALARRRAAAAPAAQEVHDDRRDPGEGAEPDAGPERRARARPLPKARMGHD